MSKGEIGSFCKATQKTSHSQEKALQILKENNTYEEFIAKFCLDCKLWHLWLVETPVAEFCSVCNGPVQIIINKGTGICSERCRKANGEESPRR